VVGKRMELRQIEMLCLLVVLMFADLKSGH